MSLLIQSFVKLAALNKEIVQTHTITMMTNRLMEDGFLSI